MREEDVRELQASLRALQRQAHRTLPSVPGVSRSAVRVLGAINRLSAGGALDAAAGGGAVAPGQVADDLAMTTSNVSAALRELEAAGYVDRRRVDGDGRRVSVALTDRGRSAVETHRALRVDRLRDAIDDALAPAEQDALAAVVPLLARVVAAHGLPHAPDRPDEPRQPGGRPRPSEQP